MRAFVLAISMLLGTALAGPPAAVAANEAMLFAPFDADAFEPGERRVLQSALASRGVYRGVIAGDWDSASQQAMAHYTAREYADVPLDLHAAFLVLDLADRATRDGWRFIELADLGISFALPRSVSPMRDTGAAARRWQAPGGGFTATAYDEPAADALLGHDIAVGDLAQGGAEQVVRDAERLLTAGTTIDGWRIYRLSVRVGQAWTTIAFEAAPGDGGAHLAALDLAAASLRRGPPLGWDLPAAGRLSALVDAALALIEAPAGDAPLPAVFATEAVSAQPGAAAWAAAPGALPPQATAEGAGTGFYIGGDLILTAEHVIAGCGSVTMADGRPLTLLASDAALDVAALAAPGPAPAWLALTAAEPLRLGQPVHALGYPYYALAGTSLNLTSGNVSALAGIDDDRRFFSFSAPVQPGNSGGPLIDRAGGVAGLVVARLSEGFIADATGTVPQNMNYAVTAGELAGFLERSGLSPATGGLGGFDMAAGAPAEIEQAIVPLLCR